MAKTTATAKPLPPVELGDETDAAGPLNESPKAALEAGVKAALCEQGDRAADGLKRFKFRLEGHPAGGRGHRYVLARDKESALACFYEAENVDPKEVDGKAVRVVAKELPD